MLEGHKLHLGFSSAFSYSPKLAQSYFDWQNVLNSLCYCDHDGNTWHYTVVLCFYSHSRFSYGVFSSQQLGFLWVNSQRARGLAELAIRSEKTRASSLIVLVDTPKNKTYNFLYFKPKIKNILQFQEQRARSLSVAWANRKRWKFNQSDSRISSTEKTTKWLLVCDRKWSCTIKTEVEKKRHLELLAKFYMYFEIHVHVDEMMNVQFCN